MDPLKVVGSESSCRNSLQDASSPDFRRLPTFATPLNYRITLKPNLETFDVIGMEEITLQINKKTDVLVLNSKNLKVNEAVWREEGSESKRSPTEIKYNEKDELLTLSFQDSLNEGKGFLFLHFQSTLGKHLTGFYRAKIKDADGKEIYNGLTQFEPTCARMCFVCYDEPALKATFDISLVVPKNKIALSNMPVKLQRDYPCDPNLVTTIYERTPIMSTYLVALVVGEFDFVESYTTDGKVRCRVYTPTGKEEQGLFALDACTKLLPYFNEYFGIDYPISKVDLVACSDFDAGAMENYGLLLFCEATLLLDPEITTLSNKQEIVTVVAHELSHQWFGNLVTMEWWDGLFLKEGFATFMETMATDYLFPDYDMWTQFVSDCVIGAMKMDAFQSSHPIEVPVNDPVEIDTIFDDISYNKGGSVIRMVHHFIGESAFKKGMAIYLSRHQYKNTTAEDLWVALEEASGKPISTMMPTWTKQMGFPILRVEAGQEGENRVLTLTQEKFKSQHSREIRKSKYETENYIYNWIIPLTFCTENQPLKVIEGELMTGKTITVVIPNVPKNQWVKLNPEFVGYYVVHYTPEMLAQFIPAIKDKSMARPLDRLNLLHDVFTITKAGIISTVEVFKLLEACQNEDNYTVWSCIDVIMAKLCILLSSNELYTQYKSYGVKLYTSIGEKIGWDRQENESHGQSLLRPLILSRLISLGHTKTIDTCVTKFNEFINENITIPADLKSLVFQGALSVGDQNTFDTVIQQYMEAEMSDEKDRIGRALAGSKDIGILHQALKFAVSENVRSQDSIPILIKLSNAGDGAIGRDIVWKHLKDNFGPFLESYPHGKVNRLLLTIAGSFVTEDQAEDIKLFFEKNKSLVTEKIIDDALEKTLINHAWMQRDEVNIANFLSGY